MCKCLGDENLFETRISYFETQNSFVDTNEKFVSVGLLPLSCDENLQLNCKDNFLKININFGF